MPAEIATEPRHIVRHPVYGAGVARMVMGNRVAVDFDKSDANGKSFGIFDISDLSVEDSLPEPTPVPAPEPGRSVSLFSTKQPVNINQLDKVDDLYAAFNDRFFIVEDFGGKCVVCEEDITDKGLRLVHQSFTDFCNRFSHLQAQVGKKKIGYGELWLKYPQRTQYTRVRFSPGKDLGESVRNLWRGFAVEEVEGDCSLYLDHLRDNICKGDPEKFEWLINWMAWKIQNPSRKSYTALVLRGGEGIGKNICFDGFAHLFGPHALLVTRKEHVSGHFNAHLRVCCVLGANEAFFAGDRQHEASLKGLITDDFFMVEPKGVDPIKEVNRISLVVISNEEWVVPASAGARRFTVFDCGDAHAEDTQYFKAIVDQLERGGYEALLHHLQHVDLSGFDERKALKTAALVDQKVQSLRGVENLWFECISRGRLHFTDYGKRFMRADTLLEWARGQGNREWKNLSANALGLLLSMNPRGNNKGMEFTKERVNGNWGWTIPSLRECRDRWDTLRWEYMWDNAESDWESAI